MMDVCMTNTCMNLVAYGAKEPSTGNNPITFAIPRRAGSLVIDMDEADAKLEQTVAFLSQLEAREGSSGVHAPGERLAQTRRKHMEQGIPVTEATWEKILASGQ